MAPTNTGTPSVTWPPGAPAVGTVLTTDNGTWTDDGSPTFTRQWQRDNLGDGVYANIAAATASTYTLAIADRACHVRSRVTDTDGTGATTASSNATPLIGNPVPLVSPPAGYTHARWYRDSSPPHLGAFYDRGAVTIPLHAACGATSFTVQMWNVSSGGFDTVKTGSLTGSETAISVPAPVGGWKYAWYRIHLDGGSSDPMFDTTLCVTNFMQAPSDPRFKPMDWFGPMGPDFANCPGAKGILGIGTSRIPIDPPSGYDLAWAVANISNWTSWWTTPGSQYLDPGRPRYVWAFFPSIPNDTIDNLGMPASGGNWYLWAYCKDGTVDGSLLTVAVSGSSGTACTITVAYNGSTVETWSVASAQDAINQINSGSSYIRVFINDSFSPGANPVNQGASHIGNTNWNFVTNVVATLYPLGVTRFEGPRNEPTVSAGEVAQQMRLFRDAVHTVAGAKAIGPSYVDFSDLPPFIAAGGLNNLDEIALHSYFLQGSDLNVPRQVMRNAKAQIVAAGHGSKKRWITEGNDGGTLAGTVTPSVNQMRQARIPLLQTLMFEEFGSPREQAPFWYDFSHTFWDVPSFLWCLDGSPLPQVPMYYTLARETWGMTYQGNYTLPVPADRFLIAQKYSDGSASTAVFMLSSYMPGATVTLHVGGASSLTVVDAFGESSTASVSSSRVTIGVNDTPVYVRLPAGVTVNVVTVNGWPTNEKVLPDATKSVTITGVGATLVPTDGGYQQYVVATGAGPWQNDFFWGANQAPTRAIIFTGSPDAAHAAPLTFNARTSNNGGSSWTTRATVDESGAATTTVVGSDQFNTGSQLDTGYHAQCVFDVPLTGALINAFRIDCSAASYGVLPNAAAYLVSPRAGGSPRLEIKQVVFRG